MGRAFEHEDRRRVDVERHGRRIHVRITLDDGDTIEREWEGALDAYLTELADDGFVEVGAPAVVAEPASFETWIAQWFAEAPEVDVAWLAAEVRAWPEERAGTVLRAIDATVSVLPDHALTDAERRPIEIARARLAAQMEPWTVVGVPALLLALRDRRPGVADACYPALEIAIDRAQRDERTTWAPAVTEALLSLVARRPDALHVGPPSALVVITLAQPLSPSAIARIASTIESATPADGADLVFELLWRLRVVPAELLALARARLENPAFTRVAAMAIARGPRARGDGDRLRAVLASAPVDAIYDLTRALSASGDTETPKQAFEASPTIEHVGVVRAYAEQGAHGDWLESLLARESIPRTIKDAILAGMDGRGQYARATRWRARLDASPVRKPSR